MKHEEQIILYAANQLNEKERANFEKHLAGCEDCKMDLQMWNLVADEIIASDLRILVPAHVAESALEMIRQPAAFVRAFRTAHQLIRAQ